MFQRVLSLKLMEYIENDSQIQIQRHIHVINKEIHPDLDEPFDSENIVRNVTLAVFCELTCQSTNPILSPKP